MKLMLIYMWSQLYLRTLNLPCWIWWDMRWCQSPSVLFQCSLKKCLSCRFYQSELLKRLKEKEPQSDILLSPENLAENLQIGLILDAQFPPLEGTSFPPVSGLTGPPTSLANMLSQHGGMAYTSSQPITNSDRKGPQDSPTTEQLQMDMKASTRAMNIQNISMEDLMSHLGQMSHQMARVVAKATNNMDQLLEGQTQNFSPNSSGNSLPWYQT